MVEIVIKIPEGLKDVFENRTVTALDVEEMRMAIKDGTLLPEQHGRLIDADAFQRYCFNKNFDKRLSEGGLATINMFLEFQQTIIEGSENE